MQTKWGLCPQITPGGEGRSLFETTGLDGTAGVVLIGFFTRQCQTLAELVVTAAATRGHAAEGRGTSASRLLYCNSTVTT